MSCERKNTVSPRSIILVLASLLLFFLLVRAYMPGKPADDVEERNVVLIGWDGCNLQILLQLLNSGRLPNLQNLMENGSFTVLTVKHGATDTKAGWPQILTGYRPYRTGVYSNFLFRRMPEGFTIHERLDDHFGDDNIETIFVAGKIRHILSPIADSAKNFDYFRVGLGKNDNVGKTALDVIEKNKDRRFFAFIHFEEPDSIGHNVGQSSLNYRDSIVADDYWLGMIVSKLKDVGVYDKTTVYVVTDHGFNDYGDDDFGHPNSPYIFLASNNPRVISREFYTPNIFGYRDRIDVAPTILEDFGISAEDVSPPMDGVSLTRRYVPKIDFNEPRPYSYYYANYGYITDTISSRCPSISEYVKYRDCLMGLAASTYNPNFCKFLSYEDNSVCVSRIYNVSPSDVNPPLDDLVKIDEINPFLFQFKGSCSEYVLTNNTQKAFECVTHVAKNTGMISLCGHLEGRYRAACEQSVNSSFR
ncbi:MAG: alkaline phosphatase [Candidatus Altiarchaeota archaeon]